MALKLPEVLSMRERGKVLGCHPGFHKEQEDRRGSRGKTTLSLAQLSRGSLWVERSCCATHAHTHTYKHTKNTNVWAVVAEPPVVRRRSDSHACQEVQLLNCVLCGGNPRIEAPRTWVQKAGHERVESFGTRRRGPDHVDRNEVENKTNHSTHHSTLP